MSPRAAKYLSRGLIVVAAAGFLSALGIYASIDHPENIDQVVVVGDVNAGDGAAVLADLQARGGRGDPLAGSPVVLVFGAVAVVWLVTGSLIVSRQARNTSGWLFSAIGAVLALGALPQVLVVKGAKVDPGSVPFLGAWAVFGDNASFIVALIPLLFLLFPDGRPPTQRWRIAEYALFGGLAVAALAYVVTPGPLNNYVDYGVLYQNPLGISALSGAAGLVSGLAGLVVGLASLSTVPAVRGRFKRSTGDERQQMRWLVAVATVAGFLFVTNFVALQILFALVPGLPDIFLYGLALLALTVALGVPGAYLIAIYRYRLYDLDLVIKKTVVFAITVMLVMVLGIGTLLAVSGPLTALMPDETTGVFAAALVIGLLVVPLWRLGRRIGDRLVYGGRVTPYEALTEFTERLSEAYATDDVLPRMAAILGESTRAAEAKVWLLVGSEFRPAAAWPATVSLGTPVQGGGDSVPDLDADRTVEVRHRGELLGALSVTSRPNDPINTGREKLMGDLAGQAGLVLRNVRLIEDLRASRQRLVAAQDQERRKLERNIHDGAQQQLVAQAVKLRLAEGLVERDPAKAREMLAQLQEDSHRTLEDLRDLARGIYPPLLADKGLVVALQGQARKSAVATTVEADGVGRYHQDVESAVYFCTLEALTNIAKYAEASAASVHLSQDDGHLSFVVRDDGAGFDPAVTGYGTGLQGMADRLAAIGGELEVTSEPRVGTTVIGRLPVAPL